jgi:hypothetical protein
VPGIETMRDVKPGEAGDGNRKAQFTLAMQSGCPTGVNSATEANTERGVGSIGRIARCYQAR